MTARRPLVVCLAKIMDVTIENAMVMLCYTAEKSNLVETLAEMVEIYFLEVFPTSITFKPGGRLCFNFSAFSGSSSDSVYR